MSSVQVDTFTQKFYSFVDGVSKGHRDVDEQLGKVSEVCAYACSREANILIIFSR
jgi:hypothetical protein